MDTALANGLFVRAAGPASGRTLVFIHAFADCGLAFTPLFATALAESFRLVVADLAGFGASPQRNDVLTISQHAESIASLVLSLSPSGPIGLVGHSVGSMIAVEVASRLGDLFGGLFSIEGNLTAGDAYFSGRAADYNDPHLFKQCFLDEIWSMAQAEQILRRYYATAIFADPIAMWELGRDERRVSNADAPGQAYRRVYPSLYYWSPATTTATTKTWIAKNDLAQRQFSDASHWPMIDRPADTARIIASFFNCVLANRRG